MTEAIDVISLGAGVQSSTMALMAAAGELTPMPIAGIFADTKGEPKSVYDWLKWLKGQLPFPVYTVSAGSLAAETLAMHRTKDGRLYSRTNIPFFTRNHDGSEGKIKFRGCTRDFKLVPLHAKQKDLIRVALPAWRKKHRQDLKALTALKRWKSAQAAKVSSDELADPIYNGLYTLRTVSSGAIAPPEIAEAARVAWANCQADPLVRSWIGISMDEASRMKPSREAWIAHRYPLIEKRITRSDCLRWMEAHGYPEPPRSACVFCPFHNDEEWRRLRDQEPREFRRAVKFEKDIQKARAASENFRTTPFLHRQLVPLTRVDFSTAGERGQLNFFENECEGMCGL